VFFTGSQNVGKEVLRHCAERLTPAVLELGGKSPCIVDSSAKIDLAARRIVWGKFLNLGQTCVAPDYILCHESVRDELLRALKREIARQFGANPLANPDYGHIVNDKHFHRLLGLIDLQKVVVGGGVNAETLQIAPTVMSDVTWEDAVMGEEIFGPVLPVLTFTNIDDVIGMLANKQKPLAFYVFAEDRATVSKFMSKCRFGGGCVNDVVIHLATSNMPFGGVGESGMGAYHGKVGFDTFSHTKSIVDKATWVDVPMRYQPFNRAIYGRLMRLFLR
jgi:aldehyde dehydrogenase (NAD+)